MAMETLMLTIALAGVFGAKLVLLVVDYAPVLATRRKAAPARQPSPGRAGFARTF